MNKATFSLFIWSKGRTDSFLKIGGLWSVKPANNIILIIFSMDLGLIDMYLPKLCFHNGDTDKLMCNKAFLILSVKHSVLFCKLYQLFFIFYVEYGQCESMIIP